MSSVEQLATEYRMNSSNVGQHHHPPPPLCSQYQLPDKTKAVEEKLSRFNHLILKMMTLLRVVKAHKHTSLYIRVYNLVMTPFSNKLDLYKN